MKALIFSDSHGRVLYMQNMIDKYPDVSYIIFAGDVNRDIEELMMHNKTKCFIYVKGNNDFFSEVPTERSFELFGIKIFLTHGHTYGVKTGLLRLLMRAREESADLCIFGHTHQRCYESEKGVILFNPGSAGTSSGILSVDDGKITLEFL